MSCRSCPTTKRNSLCSCQPSFFQITQNWQCCQIWHICVSVHISFHFIQLIRTLRSIFNKLTGDYNTFNKKHSSRMRTVRHSSYGKGWLCKGSLLGTLLNTDPQTEIPQTETRLDIDLIPGQRPHPQKEHGTRHRDPPRMEHGARQSDRK